MVSPCDPQHPVVKRRKLAWSGHVTGHNTLSSGGGKLAWSGRVIPHNTLFKTVLTGIMEGGRRRDRQRERAGRMTPQQPVEDTLLREPPKAEDVETDRERAGRMTSQGGPGLILQNC